jgi:D-arabinose 1-dehydrogenase-like Zn-dependent alcohol dehydrogenase
MLQLAVDKGVKPWITFLLVSEANKAVKGVKENVWRGEYRFVLTYDLEGGG